MNIVSVGGGYVVPRALDGHTRTDTWLPTVAERRHDTHPWDPDTDDGLTDGQEARWLTTHEPGFLTVDTLGESAPFPDTDTDGDGYWDGWLGVSDVGYSEGSNSHVL